MIYKVLSWINLAGLVVVLGFLAFQSQAPQDLGGASHFSGPVDSANGYTESGSTVVNSSGIIVGTITTSNAVTLSGGLTLSGASTTVSGINVVANSTSTGFVIRAANGSCYLFGIGAGAGSFTTSTASCN